MSNNEKILKKILALEPTDQTGKNEDIDALLSETDAVGAKTSMATLTNWCEKLIRAKKARIPIRLFELIGKVIDKHTPSPEARAAYAVRLTQLRKAIVQTYGEEKGMEAIRESKISNSKRTFERNQIAKKVRDKKHVNAFGISLTEIKDLCGKMKTDLETAPGTYQHSIVLLFELCTGARIGECINASTFTVMPKRKINGKWVSFIKQVGILKKRIENKDDPEELDDPEQKGEGQEAGDLGSLQDRYSEHDDQVGGAPGEQKGYQNDEYDPRGVLEKPVLPYADPTFLVEQLDAWRVNNAVANPGTYDEKTVKKFNNRINVLLRKRYLNPDDYPGVRIKTHLLRATYAAAAYQLFSTANQTLNAFIQAYLGHASLEIGLNYSYVKILDAKKDAVVEDPALPEQAAPVDMEIDVPAEPAIAPVYQSSAEMASLRAEVASMRSDIQQINSNFSAMRSDIQQLTSLVRQLVQAQLADRMPPRVGVQVENIPRLPEREDNLPEPEPAAVVLRRSKRLKK